jgi:hypothetical protein
MRKIQGMTRAGFLYPAVRFGFAPACGSKEQFSFNLFTQGSGFAFPPQHATTPRVVGPVSLTFTLG